MASNTQISKSTGADSGYRSLPSVTGAFGELYEDMNRLFENFIHRDPFKQFGLPSRIKGFDWSPTVDVAEHADAYEITAELPGTQEKDISVSVDDDVLTIYGEKKAERKETTRDVHLTERQYGSFQRSFRLPEDADQQKIAADFTNGVLKVTVGRTSKPKNGARHIAIKPAT